MATVELTKRQWYLGLTRVTRYYACKCGNTKTITSWGIVICGWLIDLQWFPFISVSKLGEAIS